MIKVSGPTGESHLQLLRVLGVSYGRAQRDQGPLRYVYGEPADGCCRPGEVPLSLNLTAGPPAFRPLRATMCVRCWLRTQGVHPRCRRLCAAG
jgi:hypothetical protein